MSALTRQIRCRIRKITRNRKRGSRTPRRPLMESLEKRELLAADVGPVAPTSKFAADEVQAEIKGETLVIHGTSKADVISVARSKDNQLVVTANESSVGRFSPTEITAVEVIAHDGNDFVDLSGLNARSGTPPMPTRILGGNGDDTIIGAGGRDAIFGGNGNDLLFGLKGTDTIYGGAGRDVIDVPSVPASDIAGELVRARAFSDLVNQQGGVDVDAIMHRLAGESGGKDFFSYCSLHDAASQHHGESDADFDERAQLAFAAYCSSGSDVVEEDADPEQPNKVNYKRGDSSSDTTDVNIEGRLGNSDKYFERVLHEVEFRFRDHYGLLVKINEGLHQPDGESTYLTASAAAGLAAELSGGQLDEAERSRIDRLLRELLTSLRDNAWDAAGNPVRHPDIYVYDQHGKVIRTDPLAKDGFNQIVTAILFTEDAEHADEATKEAARSLYDKWHGYLKANQWRMMREQAWQETTATGGQVESQLYDWVRGTKEERQVETCHDKTVEGRPCYELKQKSQSNGPDAYLLAPHERYAFLHVGEKLGRVVDTSHVWQSVHGTVQQIVADYVAGLARQGIVEVLKQFAYSERIETPVRLGSVELFAIRSEFSVGVSAEQGNAIADDVAAAIRKTMRGADLAASQSLDLLPLAVERVSSALPEEMSSGPWRKILEEGLRQTIPVLSGNVWEAGAFLLALLAMRSDGQKLLVGASGPGGPNLVIFGGPSGNVDFTDAKPYVVGYAAWAFLTELDVRPEMRGILRPFIADFYRYMQGSMNNDNGLWAHAALDAVAVAEQVRKFQLQHPDTWESFSLHDDREFWTKPAGSNRFPRVDYLALRGLNARGLPESNADAVERWTDQLRDLGKDRAARLADSVENAFESVRKIADHLKTLTPATHGEILAKLKVHDTVRVLSHYTESQMFDVLAEMDVDRAAEVFWKCTGENIGRFAQGMSRLGEPVEAIAGRLINQLGQSLSPVIVSLHEEFGTSFVQLARIMRNELGRSYREIAKVLAHDIGSSLVDTAGALLDVGAKVESIVNILADELDATPRKIADVLLKLGLGFRQFAELLSAGDIDLSISMLGSLNQAELRRVAPHLSLSMQTLAAARLSSGQAEVLLSALSSKRVLYIVNRLEVDMARRLVANHVSATKVDYVFRHLGPKKLGEIVRGLSPGKASHIASHFLKGDTIHNMFRQMSPGQTRAVLKAMRVKYLSKVANRLTLKQQVYAVKKLSGTHAKKFFQALSPKRTLYVIGRLNTSQARDAFKKWITVRDADYVLEHLHWKKLGAIVSGLSVGQASWWARRVDGKAITRMFDHMGHKMAGQVMDRLNGGRLLSATKAFNHRELARVMKYTRDDTMSEIFRVIDARTSGRVMNNFSIGMKKHVKKYVNAQHIQKGASHWDIATKKLIGRRVRTVRFW